MGSSRSCACSPVHEDTAVQHGDAELQSVSYLLLSILPPAATFSLPLPHVLISSYDSSSYFLPDFVILTPFPSRTFLLCPSDAIT